MQRTCATRKDIVKLGRSGDSSYALVVRSRCFDGHLSTDIYLEGHLAGPNFRTENPLKFDWHRLGEHRTRSTKHEIINS